VGLRVKTFIFFPAQDVQDIPSPKGKLKRSPDTPHCLPFVEYPPHIILVLRRRLRPIQRSTESLVLIHKWGGRANAESAAQWQRLVNRTKRAISLRVRHQADSLFPRNRGPMGTSRDAQLPFVAPHTMERSLSERITGPRELITTALYEHGGIFHPIARDSRESRRNKELATRIMG